MSQGVSDIKEYVLRAQCMEASSEVEALVKEVLHIDHIFSFGELLLVPTVQQVRGEERRGRGGEEGGEMRGQEGEGRRGCAVCSALAWHGISGLTEVFCQCNVNHVIN
jgi:hypothetical protein